MAVAHGLSPEKAEYALTLGAAEILGIADRVGSIEPSKHADLIITTDTPLQTVAQVTHVFIDGRPLDLSNMHTENYLMFKNRPAPKLPAEVELRGPKSLTTRHSDLVRRGNVEGVRAGEQSGALGR
jgi:adenine deaminase